MFSSFRIVAALINVALLAGCSGVAQYASSAVPQLAGSSGSLAQQIEGRSVAAQNARLLPASGVGGALKVVGPDAGNKGLYVSAFYPLDIVSYRMPNKNNRPPYCTISGPTEINGIGVDRKGVLWLPEQVGSAGGIVVSYASKCGAEGLTLTGNSGPVAIAFGRKGQNYVVEGQPGNGYNSSIAVFPAGATTPSSELTNPAVGYGSYTYGAGDGVDSKGNVFLSFHSPFYGNSGIIEFANGKGSGQVLAVATEGTPGASITFDKSDNMLVPDFTNAVIDVFAPPYAALTSTIALKGSSFQCTLNKSQSRLACADGTNATADIYAYPSGVYAYSINAGLSQDKYVSGIAFDPSSR